MVCIIRYNMCPLSVLYNYLPGIPVITRHVIVAVPVLIAADFLVEEVVFSELLFRWAEVVD